MPGAPRGVLLVGATGLLGGQLLLRYLADDEEVPIRLLVRGSLDRGRRIVEALITEAAPAVRERFARRVSFVLGDATLPGLGLAPTELAQLAATTTHIVNSAVNTDFSLSLEMARVHNVGSVERLLELARRCPRLVGFAHMSTVAVAGRRSGRVLEGELEHDEGWANGYEQSKYEAEQVARAAMTDLPIAVFRTSTLVGDSRTGHVRQYNHMHRAFFSMKHCLIPALPGDPAAPVDLVPVDYAVDAIHHLVARRFVPGATYHVSGGPGVLALEPLVRLVHEHFRARGKLTRPEAPAPAIVSREAFDALFEDAAARRLSPRVITAMRPMRYYLVQLGLPKTYDVTRAAEALAGTGIAAAPTAEYLPRVLDHCLHTGFGMRIDR